MQEMTCCQSFAVRCLLMMSLVLFCATDNIVAQTGSQPDSIIAKPPVSFYPKPITGKSFILPLAFIATGALGISGEFIISDPEIKEERDESFRNFHTSLDNYLQFAPIAAGYAMLINNREHSFWIYTEKVVVTEVLTTAAVQSAKRITDVKRPDGTRYSFPSGHTAQAFAGATIFSDEFAQHKPWLAVTAYAGASAVGALRILNNRHWASDVIAGAGFGILSAKTSEWMINSYNKKHHTKHTYTFQF